MTPTEHSQPSGEKDARAQFVRAVARLRAVPATPEQEALTHRCFDRLWHSGQQPSRYYHGCSHYRDVAGNLPAEPSPAEAVRYVAGMYHDVVYHHVDVKLSPRALGGEAGFAPGVAEVLQHLATLQTHRLEGKPFVEIQFNRPLDAATSALMQGAHRLFHDRTQIETMPLDPYRNQNEYLSALLALHDGLALGIAPRHVLAVLAMIEGTCPFGARDRLVRLGERLNQASHTLQQAGLVGLSPDEQAKILYAAEAMGNCDVANFREDYPAFIANSRKLLAEALPRLGDDFDNPAAMLTAMRNMCQFMEFVASHDTMCVFHHADGTPHADDAAAKANIAAAAIYLKASVAGIALLMADNIERGEASHSLRRLSARALTPFIGMADATAPHPESAPILAELASAPETHPHFASDALAAQMLRAITPPQLAALCGDMAALDANQPASLLAFKARLLGYTAQVEPPVALPRKLTASG